MSRAAAWVQSGRPAAARPRAPPAEGSEEQTKLWWAAGGSHKGHPAGRTTSEPCAPAGHRFQLVIDLLHSKATPLQLTTKAWDRVAWAGLITAPTDRSGEAYLAPSRRPAPGEAAGEPLALVAATGISAQTATLERGSKRQPRTAAAEEAPRVRAFTSKNVYGTSGEGCHRSVRLPPAAGGLVGDPAA